MNNSFDKVLSNNLLNANGQIGRTREVAGNKGKDVDETNSRKTEIRHGVVLAHPAVRMIIERELETVPLADRTKVQRIKDRIATGNFEINAERIASQLLATEQILI